MTLCLSDLNAIPLFEGITEPHLEALLAAFERQELDAGVVLFEAGAAPEHFHLLTKGAVELRQHGEPRFSLTPIAPIGELGALAGLRRHTTAVTTQPSEIHRIASTALVDFFERHGDVAFPFHHNLLRVVALKVKRDARRADEMRDNIVRTQKAMKRLLDAVLAAPETPWSKEVAETLEDLIEHNRRSHYLVGPTGSLRSALRLDDGALAPVLELSDTLLRLSMWRGGPPKVGSHISGVLVTESGEIPMSGRVEESGPDSVLVALDLLIDDYQRQLSDYLTRVQMLDFVV